MKAIKLMLFISLLILASTLVPATSAVLIMNPNRYKIVVFKVNSDPIPIGYAVTATLQYEATYVAFFFNPGKSDPYIKITGPNGDIVTQHWWDTQSHRLLDNSKTLTWQFKPETLGKYIAYVGIWEDGVLKADKEVSFTVTGPPGPVVSLTATPTIINAGDTSILTWTSTNAVSVTINNNVDTKNKASGTTVVSPSTSTTYTATATNAQGNTVSQTTITVIGTGGGGANEPTVTITADKMSITSGGAVKLTWSSTKATSVTIDHGVETSGTISGSTTIYPAGTTTYKATATGTGGSKTATVTITVGAGHAPTTPITPMGPASGTTGNDYSFVTQSTDIDGNTICYMFDWGDGYKSDWSELLNSGVSCTASHSWTKIGSFKVKAIAKDVTNLQSSYSSEKTISITSTIQNTPKIDKFTIMPDHVKYGESFKLEYAVSYTSSVSIDHNVYSGGAHSGSFYLKGNATAIYTLTAIGPSGSSTIATVSISVDQPEKPIVSFLSSKTDANPNDYITLSWSSTGATSVIIDNSIVTRGETSGTTSFRINTKTTYTATATGPGGSSTASVTINVAGTGGDGGPWFYIIIIIFLAFVIINMFYRQTKGVWIPYGYYGASIWSWIKNSEPPEKPKAGKKKDAANDVTAADKSYFDYVIQYGNDNAEVKVKNQRRQNKKKSNVKKRGKRR